MVSLEFTFWLLALHKSYMFYPQRWRFVHNMGKDKLSALLRISGTR